MLNSERRKQLDMPAKHLLFLPNRSAGDPPRTFIITPVPAWGDTMFMHVREQQGSSQQIILSLPAGILSWSAEHQQVQAHSHSPLAQATSRLCPSRQEVRIPFQPQITLSVKTA